MSGDPTLLRAVTDEREIIRLVTLYTRAIDTRDRTLGLSLFTEDAVGNYTETPSRGPAAIIDLLFGMLEKVERTLHVGTNHVVEVDGDEGLVTWYLQAQHVAGDASFMIGGMYVDAVRRTAKGWRISRRDFQTIWAAGDSTLVGMNNAALAVATQGGRIRRPTGSHWSSILA